MVQEELFSINDLAALDYTNTGSMIKHKISFSNPGENLLMRPLGRNDYRNGYFDVLAQLTSVGDITEERFQQRFDNMKACKNSYYIVVIEDSLTGKVIGSGTVAMEHQINSTLQVIKRGRIEDIVVLDAYRGKFLGKLILDTLDLLAKHLNCDELSLECKDHLVKFYNQFGLHLVNEVYMRH